MNTEAAFGKGRSELSTLDPHPDRDFATVERLARILQITGRQVRRLAADRVLRREHSGPFKGMFRIVDATQSYVAHASQRRVVSSEKNATLKTAILKRRLDAEEANLIPLADALFVFDHIIGAFSLAIDEIDRQAAGVVRDPARAASAIEHTRLELGKRFDRQRQRLVTGKAK